MLGSYLPYLHNQVLTVKAYSTRRVADDETRGEYWLKQSSMSAPVETNLRFMGQCKLSCNVQYTADFRNSVSCRIDRVGSGSISPGDGVRGSHPPEDPREMCSCFRMHLRLIDSNHFPNTQENSDILSRAAGVTYHLEQPCDGRSTI